MKRLILALLLAAAAAHAQIALVSHVSAGPSGTNTGPTSTAAQPIDTTGANCIVICVSDYGQTHPQDPFGNTYVKMTGRNSGGDLNISMWVAYNPITSASHTFSTVSSDGATMAVAAFSGVASAPDALGTGFASAATADSPVSAGLLNPSKPNEMALSCAGGGFGGVPTVKSPLVLLDANGSSAWPVGMAYQIQGATATSVEPQWSGNNGPYVAMAATFFSTLSPGPLAVTTVSLPEGFRTQAYSQTITSSGGISPKSWALTGGTLPGGVTLSSAGGLSGTPTTSGTYNPVFTVTDAQSQTASSSGLSWIVAAQPFNVTIPTCPEGKQYTAYAGCTIGATGGTPPYSFSYALNLTNTIGPDALPEGLALNTATGLISGTVTGQGAYQPSFTVTDAAGTVVSGLGTIPIDGDNTFGGTALFPPGSIFNGVDISALPVDTSPAVTTLSGHVRPIFGYYVAGGGVPINTVTWDQPLIPNFCPTANTVPPGGNECDQVLVPAGPWSSTTAVEGTTNNSDPFNYKGDDGHSPVVVKEGGGQPAKLFESFVGRYLSVTNTWALNSNAMWVLSSTALRPTGTGSTDAAGLPVGPLLANADQVLSAGGQKTPIRFTVPHGMNGHVWPATAQAGIGGCPGGYVDQDSKLLSQAAGQRPTTCSTSSAPFGEIYRVKASSYATPPAACLTNFTTNPQAASLFRTLRFYGLILSDNGLGIGLVGTNDARWNDSDLACLNNIQGTDLEPVNVSSLMVSVNSMATTQTPVAPPVRLPVIQGARPQGGVIRP